MEKLKRGEHTQGVDAWRYVEHVAAPLMWPECLWRWQHNPDFVLMEDGAPCHSAHYTSQEREKQGIPKLDWVSNSPDFNPIERIWTILKRRILWRHASERITTITGMKAALYEEWGKINVSNRDVGPNTISDTFRARTLHHPFPLKME